MSTIADYSPAQLRETILSEIRNSRLGVLVRQLQGAAPLVGTGTPEGAVEAPVGRLFTRLDGGAGTTLYVKESGTGNTGWVGK